MLPSSLKPIQHYLKIADEHAVRDPVITYYCRMYAVQKGIKLDSSSPDAKKYLFGLMDTLETMKKSMTDNEAIQSEVVGQAHIEDYALKVFLFADNQDRAGQFSKNVVKSFYSSGMLFDVLEQFGELGEDIEANKKYAKWKAAYIHKCLKSGETPISGPMPDEDAEGGYEGAPQPGSSTTYYQDPAAAMQQPMSQLSVQPGIHAPPTTPAEQPQYPIGGATAASGSGKTLTPLDYEKAMKMCKYASSACQYEDRETAIDNLRQALAILES